MTNIIRPLCIFLLILFLGSCDDINEEHPNYAQLASGNLGAMFREFYSNDYQNASAVNYLQVLQIIDSLGTNKIRLGILAGCINMTSEKRELIFGGDVYFNDIHIPFNNQNFYSKWFEDTISIGNLMKDTINWRITGNSTIAQNNAIMSLPFPRPYKMKAIPDFIIKESYETFDSVIYYSGVNNYGPTIVIEESNSFVLQGDNNLGNAIRRPGDAVSLKPGICLIGGFIETYTTFLSPNYIYPTYRLIEYKKYTPVK